MAFATYPSLAGRVVFITGGGSGIGAAMVAAFAANEASVAFVDIDRAASEALVRDLAGCRRPPLFIPCDLTDTEAMCWWWAYCAAMRRLNARSKGPEDPNPDFVKPR